MSCIRGFENVEMLLPDRVAVLIGKNGTNKTTFLRTLAMSLAGPADGQALLSLPVGPFLRSGESAGDVALRLSGEGRIDLRLSHGTTVFLDPTGKGHSRTEQSERIEMLAADPLILSTAFVAGYGIGRGMIGSDSGRGYRVLDSVLSLFDYRQELIDPELTLRRLRDHLGSDKYEQSLIGIRRVLGLTADDEVVLAKGGGVALRGPSVGNTEIPLAAWADGYRLTFTWLLDLFARAIQADAINEKGNVEGIVLVDEIDQHLHPSLQGTVVRDLSTLLPDAQLIMTTHSPLVALGATPDQLIVLQRRENRIEVEPNIPDYRTWTVQDMLGDDRLFDTPVYAPAFEQTRLEYQSLVAAGRDGRSASDSDRLRTIASDIQGSELPPSLAARLAEADEEMARRIAAAQSR